MSASWHNKGAVHAPHAHATALRTAPPTAPPTRRRTAPLHALPLHAMAQHSVKYTASLPVPQPARRPRATPDAAITPAIRRHYAATAPPLPPSHCATTTPHPPPNPQAITPQIRHIAPLWHHPTGHAQKVPHAPPKPRKLAPIFLGGTTPTYVPHKGAKASTRKSRNLFHF